MNSKVLLVKSKQYLGTYDGNYPPNNQIWYTSTDGNIVNPYNTNVFGANIISNTYENGKGIIKFEGSVPQIGKNAFTCGKNMEDATDNKLETICVPQSCKTIGYGAFGACLSLTKVFIPDGCNSFDSLAFAYSPKIDYIQIPSTLTSIGDYCFLQCYQLNVQDTLNRLVSVGITNIPKCAFKETTAITINIPTEIESVGEYAFSMIHNLQSIEIHAKYLDYRAFYKNNDLVFANIGSETIDSSVNIMQYCDKLTCINIGTNMNTIQYAAFSNNPRISHINIPSNIKTIDIVAFAYDNNLTSVVLNEGLETIGDYSFYGCGLEFVSIPKTVSRIGEGAFGDCTKLKRIKLNTNTPPTIGSLCFYDESETNILIEQILVPKNSVETYKSTKEWTEYSDKIIGY